MSTLKISDAIKPNIKRVRANLHLRRLQKEQRQQIKNYAEAIRKISNQEIEDIDTFVKYNERLIKKGGK